MVLNTLYILLLFAAVVLLSALQKPIFMLWYAEQCSEASAAELWGVVEHGLSLDATMAGYICALPVLFLLLSTLFPHIFWRRATQYWLYVAATVVAVSFSVNLGLYEFWGFPLDGSIMQYLATPREAMASVTPQMFVVQTVVAVVYSAVMVLLCRQIVRIYNPTLHLKWGRRLIYSLFVLLLAGLDFLAIRGGVTTAVANVSKVYFSDKIILNHAAVNPTFSFISSLSAGEDLSRYDYFESEACAAQFEALKPKTAATESLLTTSRPNIVMIIAESFGRSTIDEHVAGESVAPNIQRLKGEGVWFENMIASSFRTDRGVLATLSGFCAQPTMSIMKEAQRASRLPSIAGSLREVGYRTSYIHGGDLNFTDMASYLYATGFDKLVAYKDLHFDAPTSKWGYADDVLADYFVDFINQQGGEAPYFTVWQTLSSHEPFDVPTAVFEDKMLSSMHFADSCINSVVEALRQSESWDNTLVVIIADHAYLYPYGISASAVERHRIPMLWLGGAVKEPRVVDAYCSQSDLAATLLQQLGVDHSQFTLSRDIFAADYQSFGYYTFNNGFGVVDSLSTTIYDCTTESVITGEGGSQEQIGKTMLQTTYNIIKEL
ncbi:MAG: LTA synthase family protein [Alistipes sp.]|nr:LTA synthase family protein [Alistipes sp.]